LVAGSGGRRASRGELGGDDDAADDDEDACHEFLGDSGGDEELDARADLGAEDGAGDGPDDDGPRGFAGEGVDACGEEDGDSEDGDGGGDGDAGRDAVAGHKLGGVDLGEAGAHEAGEDGAEAAEPEADASIADAVAVLGAVAGADDGHGAAAGEHGHGQLAFGLERRAEDDDG
jgi:hypothetical protein